MGTMLAHALEGWFLFDVGLAIDFREEAVYAPLFVWGPLVLRGDGDPLLDALAACGVRLDEITAVVLSHLHHDHTGGLRHFGGGRTPVLVQQAELDHVASGDAGAFVRPVDWEPYDLAWQPLAGATTIATGIEAIPSPGHTPGHQSFLLTLASGDRLLFTYDAVPSRHNLELDVVTTIVAGDPAVARATQDMLVQRARDASARLIPGHCPQRGRRCPSRLRICRRRSRPIAAARPYYFESPDIDAYLPDEAAHGEGETMRQQLLVRVLQIVIEEPRALAEKAADGSFHEIIREVS